MRCNPGQRDDILPVDTIADLRPTQMLREPREFVMSMYGKQLEMVMEDPDRMEWNRRLRMISE